MRKALAFGFTLAATVCAAAAAAAGFSETGSTLLFPLIQTWAQSYQDVAGVSLATEASGSSKGVAGVLAQSVDIGASDVPAKLKPDDLAKVVQIPLVVSGVQINYNVAGIGAKPLRLNGSALAAIYDGSAPFWDDKRIAALNPLVKLPHQRIVPLRRGDGSGSTALFTAYLGNAEEAWKTKVGSANMVPWPHVDGEEAAVGNANLWHLCEATPYSIAYVGFSYRNRTDAAHLGLADLENRARTFVSPSAESIAAAADAVPPAEAEESLVNAPGAKSYPLGNLEFAVVRRAQPDAEHAKGLRDLLTWIVSPAGGNAPKYLDGFHFAALPAPVRARSLGLIDVIGAAVTQK